MRNSELLEALVQLSDQARAGGENQHSQPVLAGRSRYSGYLVSLAGARRCLHDNAPVTGVQCVTHPGKLAALVVA
jgi:hypothetical protein